MPRFVESKQAAVEPDAATIEKHATDAMARIDATSAASWQLLARVRQARNVVLTQERARQAAKLGADSATVQAIDAQMAANRVLAAHLALQARRTAVAVPTASADEWILYGNVHHADATPAAGATVALYVGGQRLGQSSCDTTDGDGNYPLRVPMATFAGRVATPHIAVTADSGAAAADAAAHAAGPVVTVRILDGQGACLTEASDKFVPKGGSADYLEVTLPTAGAAPPAAPTTTPPPPKSTPPKTTPPTETKSKAAAKSSPPPPAAPAKTAPKRDRGDGKK